VANNAVSTLASSNLSYPQSVAVDGMGNVYIADSGDNAIKEWMASNSNLITLVSSNSSTPLSNPQGVALDSAGNVYIADTYDSAIKEWTTSNGNVTTLVSNGLSAPNSLAVDAAGNVYIADSGNNTIKEWIVASSNLITLVNSNLDGPPSVSVDGSGNVYFVVSEAAGGASTNEIQEWMAVNANITTFASTALIDFPPSFPYGVSVDARGNIYISYPGQDLLRERPCAFVDPTCRLETDAGGSDAVPLVLPVGEKLYLPFAPTSDQSWLTIGDLTNGFLNFSFTANTGPDRVAHITVIGQTIPVTQGGTAYSLGRTALVVGPAPGTNSVIIMVTPSNGSWTAATNDTWLHLNPATQSGVGSTNLIFSYNANPGATRSGSLTIGDQMLVVVQAGSTYVAAQTVTALVASGLSNPYGAAVDHSGNVYFADTGNGALKEWVLADNAVSVLVDSGLDNSQGVAVDSAGNIYFPIPVYDEISYQPWTLSSIEEWTVANSNVTTLVAAALLGGPLAVAVDGAGNVYMAETVVGDAYTRAGVEEWTTANKMVTHLLTTPPIRGVAVDGAGNVYFRYNNAIGELTVANGNLTALATPGLDGPEALAVDGGGNVYICDTGNGAIKEWAAADGSLTTLISSISPSGVAVDASGNVYFANHSANTVLALPYAFVDPTRKLEGTNAGADSLPTVLPFTENLLPPFAPTSDQSWLPITGITNGVVSFSFTATPSNRVGHITLLGQTIPIVQAGLTPPNIASAQILSNGLLQFEFTNGPGGSFTVLSSTNLSLPLSNWTVVGNPVEAPPGNYQFTSQPTTNDLHRFYTIRSP